MKTMLIHVTKCELAAITAVACGIAWANNRNPLNLDMLMGMARVLGEPLAEEVAMRIQSDADEIQFAFQLSKETPTDRIRVVAA